MERNIDTLYVVTGISRLTGEREAVSKPTSFLIAVALRSKWKRKPARKRDYLFLKVEPYNPCLHEE
jgi:hypothetical protein